MVRDSSRKQILKEYEESLRRLNTDYVNLYQVHAYDEKTPIGETAETLAELLEQGKIGAIGVSNYDTAQVAEFARNAPLHTIQPPYNIIMRDIENSILPHAQPWRHNLQASLLGASDRKVRLWPPIPRRGFEKRQSSFSRLRPEPNT